MTYPPPIVVVSLIAIAVPGLVLAIVVFIAGWPQISALFLLLPIMAWATWHAKRGARGTLFTCALLATMPLQSGVLLAWPHLSDALPALAGLVAIVGGLIGMLTRTSRDWYAAARAHRAVGL